MSRPSWIASRTRAATLVLAGFALGSACSSTERRTAPAAPPPAPVALQDSGAWQAHAPLARDDAERRVLDVLQQMGADRERRYLSVSEADGRLMRQLAEASGARKVVELGTSTGYSGLWLALALRKTGGHLHTHELDPGRAETARANFEKAGVSELVTVIVGDAHETVKRHEGPIDLVFLDADKAGYVDYLAKLLPHVRPGGLILAHNMHRPAPAPDFVEAITTDPALDTLFLHMDEAGISLTLKKR